MSYRPGDMGALKKSDKFNDGEKLLIEFMTAQSLGHFYTHVFEAISRADHVNTEKMRKAFPQEVQAYHDWTRTGTLYDRWKAFQEELELA